MDTLSADNRLARSPVSPRVWLWATAACTAAGIAGAFSEWWVAALPLSVLLGLFCILQPAQGLYLLIISLFFPYSTLAGFRLYAADIFLFLIVIGFWLQRAQQGKPGLTRTPLDLPIALWLGVMALSLVNAYDLQRGIINWLRHVQLLLLIYAVARLAPSGLSSRLVITLAALAATIGMFNLVPFIQSGGSERIYGIAGISMNSILTVVIVYLAGPTCFERNPTRARIYAAAMLVSIFAQIANQSRAALAIAGLGLIIVIILTLKWSSVHHATLPRTRALRLITTGVVLILLLVILAAPLLETTIDRFAATGNAGYTLRLRYFLWETALSTYLDHPLLGLGLGQVQVWHEIDPSLRLDWLGVRTFGLGTHLSFLKYLAETGTVGAIALLLFQLKVIQMGFKLIRRTKKVNQAGHVIGVVGVVLTIILRSFVEGGFFFSISGITTALFFGFLVNMYLQSEPNGNRRRSAQNQSPSLPNGPPRPPGNGKDYFFLIR